MSNVVAFKARKKEPVVLPTNKPPETVMDFISEELYPWAQAHGIDIESTDFKFESATVMTVLQGMMFRATK